MALLPRLRNRREIETKCYTPAVRARADKRKGHRVEAMPFIAFIQTGLADQLSLLREREDGRILYFDALIQV